MPAKVVALARWRLHVPEVLVPRAAFRRTVLSPPVLPFPHDILAAIQAGTRRARQGARGGDFDVVGRVVRHVRRRRRRSERNGCWRRGLDEDGDRLRRRNGGIAGSGSWHGDVAGARRLAHNFLGDAGHAPDGFAAAGGALVGNAVGHGDLLFLSHLDEAHGSQLLGRMVIR